jgi:hypothetical protein
VTGGNSLKIFQIDFKFTGPWGDELAASRKERAEEISAVPGLIWKIWTENSETGEGGGVYLFEDLGSLRKYKEMHVARLSEAPGISDIRAKEFDVNEALTEITGDPIK